MNWGLVGLFFAYAVLAILLYVLIRHTRWGFLIKTAATIAVGCLFYVSAHSYPPLIGWPTSVDLPKRFNLIGMSVEEPNKTTQTKGRIYIWVTDMEQQLGKNVPRAYVLPYTPALHNKLNDTSKKLRKNLPQLGESEKRRNETTGAMEVDLQFFDMPDPLFPEK
jgi:hypothetical protein